MCAQAQKCASTGELAARGHLSSSYGAGKAPAAINFRVNSQRMRSGRKSARAKYQLCPSWKQHLLYLALVHHRVRPKNAPHTFAFEALSLL